LRWPRGLKTRENPEVGERVPRGRSHVSKMVLVPKQARASKASAPTKAAGVPLLGKGKKPTSQPRCMNRGLAGRDWV
jgi:hypothetical protein